MKRTKEWEALNRIWKALTIEQREELYNDFELIHSVIKKNHEQKEKEKEIVTLVESTQSIVEEQKAYGESETIKKDYKTLINQPEILILRQEGNFCSARGKSAVVLSNMFYFKIHTQKNGQFKTGFPMMKYQEYIRDIQLSSVSYVIIGRGTEVIEYKEFANNRFAKYVKDVPTTKEPEKPDWVAVGDVIVVMDIETEEEQSYRIMDSYIKHEVTGAKDIYGNRVVKETQYSYAKVSEGSISIDAPIVKAIKGKKQGDLFEVKIGEEVTKYKLIAIERVRAMDTL